MKIVVVVVAVAAFLVGAILLRAMKTGEKIPAAGTPAPDFTLNSQEREPLSLHDFRGKWVVLYFYPKDFTSGCTVEAHNFQRDITQYEQKGAVILGVSVQTEDSHKQFCVKEGLSFKLLADTKHEVSKKYDSLMNLGIAKISARHTFLIDPDGIIRAVYQKVDPSSHSSQVLSDITSFQKASGSR
jgi:peroxiredoxin Q/BCP